MSLPTRKIGNDDVPAMSFGLMGMSAFYSGSTDNDEERFKVLDAAVELGATFWDTADVYGDSEDLVGKWFKRTGKRSQIFLATKFGITSTAEGNGTTVNGKPEYVRAAVEKSMNRLGVETIDLYYLHRADKTTPIEITVGAMAELVKEGKVRYLGLSEISAATLRRAHAIHPIAAVEVEYSPFCLDIEDEKIGLLKACRELGVAVVAYSPLGRGMLTGKYKSNDDIPADDWRKNVPKFSNENFPNILRLVKAFEKIGQKHGASSGQVTLAWLLEQGAIPLFGTTKISSLKENLGAFDIKLSPEEVKELRNVAEKVGAGQVDRYPPEDMAALFVDTPEL